MNKDPDRKTFGPSRPADLATETVYIAFSRAEESLRRGQLREADALYRQVSARQQDNPATCANLGLVLQQPGQVEDTLARYDQALALNPGLPETRYNRGSVLRALGRPQEALASKKTI